jgi:asparagine synthase (glutamine-hydrolysing)
MCGILGSLNLSFDDSALDLLKHRGPDDFGITAFHAGRHTVLFGHRRLSILDLSAAGHQPMVSQCGRYAIIFNGEIYNHSDLRKKLPSSIQYSGHCDTETILYYLKHFGINGVADLNGIFSLALLDTVQNKLYLARDPFGVKPLYYAASESTLIFSSEIRPLKTLLKKVSLDKAALASLLRLRYNASPETLYREVQKIRPGHCMTIDLNKNQVDIDHHCFIKPNPPEINLSLQQSLRQYSDVIEEAVGRQLLADVQVGILLSGGVDSAVVAALAKKSYSGTLKAFTIGFEGTNSEDEIEDAAETARILGLEHHYKKISFTDFLDQINKCTRIVEEPLATTSIIPMYFLAELASKHVKVVLTGQGADEPLGGYKKYKLELLQNMMPKFVNRMIHPLVRLANVKNETVIRGASALRFDSEIDRFMATLEVFSIEEIEQLLRVRDTSSLKRVQYFYDTLKLKHSVTPVERLMALDTRLNLSDDLLNYTDKLTMHFSLECRVPMLDLELLRFIESLARRFKVTLTEGKRIHKMYARKFLPEAIINRKKKGFESPTRSWFISESEKIKDILLLPGSEFSRQVNQSFVANIIAQHKRGFNMEKQIFLLLTIFFWLENVND